MQCLEHTRDPQARQPQPPARWLPPGRGRPWRRLVILPFTGGKTEARESSLSRKQGSWGWSPAGLAPPAPRPRAVLSQLPSRWARGRRPRCVGGLPWSPGGASTCIQPFHPSETRGNSPQILLLLLLGMSLRSCPSCTHSPSGTHLPRGRSPSPPGAHKSLHSRPGPLPDHASSPTPPQPHGPPHCPEAFAHAVLSARLIFPQVRMLLGPRPLLSLPMLISRQCPSPSPQGAQGTLTSCTLSAAGSGPRARGPRSGGRPPAGRLRPCPTPGSAAAAPSHRHLTVHTWGRADQ